MEKQSLMKKLKIFKALSSKDVQDHMTSSHQPVNWEERIKILESELRMEKGQHQDHLNMLEVTLKESSEDKQKIKG